MFKLYRRGFQSIFGDHEHELIKRQVFCSKVTQGQKLKPTFFYHGILSEISACLSCLSSCPDACPFLCFPSL